MALGLMHMLTVLCSANQLDLMRKLLFERYFFLYHLLYCFTPASFLPFNTRAFQRSTGSTRSSLRLSSAILMHFPLFLG
jgi:hypothetical protein